ncbi:hypothetical protein BH10PLA1_BH10PLA1_17990 [soil metagenome]
MLSAEALSEIVTAFGSNEFVDPTHKNRRAMRVQHNGRTMIFRAGENLAATAIPVQMRDISARGCSFTCNTKLARGSNFVIQFSRKNQPPSGVLCTVVHCRGTPTGYRVGAEFTCSLDNGSTDRAANLSELDRIRNSILD